MSTLAAASSRVPTRPIIQYVTTKPLEKNSCCTPDGSDSLNLTDGVYLATEVGASLDGVRWVGAASDDQLGTAVGGVGDVTGNGFDDIVMGAPLSTPDIQGTFPDNAGTVYLSQGFTSAASFSGERSIADIGTSVPGTLYVGRDADEFAGRALADGLEASGFQLIHSDYRSGYGALLEAQ